MSLKISSWSKEEQSNLFYTFFCVLFTSLLILSNMTLKLFKAPFFPQLALTSGLLTYPITFLITDTVTEIWGSAKAKLMVVMAFAMNLLMLIFVQTTIALPAHDNWLAIGNPFGYLSTADYQTALKSVFGVSTYILIGSSVAYLVSQFLDIKVFSLIRKKTKGKHLWLRNNISICLSQLIDTFIMDGIVLYLGLRFSLKACLLIGVSVYIYKVVFTVLETPFIYLFTHFLKRRLGIYDHSKAY